MVDTERIVECIRSGFESYILCVSTDEIGRVCGVDNDFVKVEFDPPCDKRIFNKNEDIKDVTDFVRLCDIFFVDKKQPDGSYKKLKQLIEEITVAMNNDRVIFERYIDGFLVCRQNFLPICTVVDVNIIVPNKVVEVMFSDGTKEKSVCYEPDTFSIERAVAVCIGKKVMGGSSAYNNAVKQGVKVYEDKVRDAELAKKKEEAEKARIEKRRLKRQAYKARRAEIREKAEMEARAAETERQIEIQKEAYVRAIREMGLGCHHEDDAEG